MDSLSSGVLAFFSWVAYLNPLAFTSIVFGFLGWAIYLTPFIICFVVYLSYLAFETKKNTQAGSWVFFGGLAAGFVLTYTLPYINAAYLSAVGTHSAAVIERVTPFTEIFFNRTPSSARNQRLDLSVARPDGTIWKTYIHRRTGLTGPTFAAGSRLAPGDELVVAYIEAAPANIVVVPSQSPAVWQGAARDLDAVWEISPPQDHWMSHRTHRERIERYIEEYGDITDADVIERFTQRLAQLTIPVPSEFERIMEPH